jgi:putative endonuclease
VHYVYILECADGTLYTGYARDPRQREAVHNRGRGARYTRARRPVRLVYVQSFRSVGAALRREHAIKTLSRAEKRALILARDAGRAEREELRAKTRAKTYLTRKRGGAERTET